MAYCQPTNCSHGSHGSGPAAHRHGGGGCRSSLDDENTNSYYSYVSRIDGSFGIGPAQANRVDRLTRSTVNVPNIIDETLTKTLLKYSVSAVTIGREDLYVKPRRGNQRAKKSKTYEDPHRKPQPRTEEQHLALEWGKRPKKVLVFSHLQRVIVVTGPDESQLMCSSAEHISKDEKEQYFVPSCVVNNSNSLYMEASSLSMV